MTGIPAEARVSHDTVRRQPLRNMGLPVGLLILVLATIASLCIGSSTVPPRQVADAFLAFDPQNDNHLIVQSLRLPRTFLAILCGAALGMAGTIMQAITRNALAEPGLLGVNAGAGTAVIIAVSVFGLGRYEQYVWFGFVGAGIAGIAVFLLGHATKTGTNTVRLILAGAGVSIMLGSVIGTIILNAPLDVLDMFRHWSAGSLDGRGMDVILLLAAVVAAASVVSMAIAGHLNAMALGDELGQALGVNLGLIWTISCLCIMLLAGGATAAAGPIGFVGLVAPHFSRWIAGADYRWLLPYSALFGATMLLIADIVGRVIATPAEVAAGIVVMLIGGPFFIFVVSNFRLRQI